MKPSYYRKRNAFLSSPSRVIAFWCVIVVVLLFTARFVFPNFFFSLTTPLFSFGNSIAHTQVRDDALRQSANTQLQNENAQLRERITDLVRLLGTDASVPQGVVVGVIARPPLAPYDTFLIGAGSEEGLVSGQVVSAQGGVPVGTVEMVAPMHAQVALFSTAERETEGWVGDERVPITLVGEGGGAFVAQVSRDASITEGAPVLIAGPGARLVGHVRRIDADPSSPTATLRIQPLVNIFSVTVVVVENPS